MNSRDYPRHRPSVAEVQPLIDAYYQLDQNSVGGALHIVLDDDNKASAHIEWCIRTAPEHRAGHVEATQALCRVLLLMTPTQRGKLRAGYGHGPTHEGRGPEMPESELLKALRAIEEKYR